MVENPVLKRIREGASPVPAGTTAPNAAQTNGRELAHKEEFTAPASASSNPYSGMTSAQLANQRAYLVGLQNQGGGNAAWAKTQLSVLQPYIARLEDSANEQDKAFDASKYTGMTSAQLASERAKLQGQQSSANKAVSAGATAQSSGLQSYVNRLEDAANEQDKAKPTASDQYKALRKPLHTDEETAGIPKQKVDTKTVERAWNTVSGAAKQYAGSMFSGAGAVSEAMGGTAMTDVYSEQVRSIEEQKKVVAQQYANAKTDAERREALDQIQIFDRALEMYGAAVKANQQTGSAAREASREISQSGAIDIAKAKAGLGGVGRFVVDASVAGVQMAGDIALGLSTGGSALFPMFLRSFGGGTEDAAAAGATIQQQILYGFGAGVLSVLTEKISNVTPLFQKAFGGKGFAGKVLQQLGSTNVITKTVLKLNSTAAGRLALSAFSEGGEELIEDFLQPFLKNAIYSKNEKFDLSESLYDFAVGAALGGIGGGVDTVKDVTLGRAIKALGPEVVQAVIDSGLESAKGTDSNSLATSMSVAKRLDPMSQSDANVGQLQRLNEQQIEEEEIEAAEEKAKERATVVLSDVATRYHDSGVSTQLAQERSDLVTKIANNEVISDAEAETLDLTNGVTRAILKEKAGIDISAPATKATALAIVNAHAATNMAGVVTKAENEALRQRLDAAVADAVEMKANAARVSMERVTVESPKPVAETPANTKPTEAKSAPETERKSTAAVSAKTQNGDDYIVVNGKKLTRDTWLRTAERAGVTLSEETKRVAFENMAKRGGNEIHYATEEKSDVGETSHADGRVGGPGVRSGKQSGAVQESTGESSGQNRNESTGGAGSRGASQENRSPVQKSRSKPVTDSRSGLSSADPARYALARKQNFQKFAAAEKEAQKWADSDIETTPETVSGEELNVIPAESYNAAIYSWGKRVERLGGRLYPSIGELSNPMAGGFHQDGNIVVRMDSDEVSGTDRIAHEFLHLGCEKDTDLQKQLEDVMLSGFSEEDIKQLDNEIAYAYETYANVLGEFSPETKVDYYQEVLCDLFDNVNRKSWLTNEQFSLLHSKLNEAVEEWEDGQTSESLPSASKKRNSIDTYVEALGLTFEKDGNTTILRDAAGKRVSKMTPEQVKNTTLGLFINLATKPDAKTGRVYLSKENAEKQYKFFSDLTNLMLTTQDVDMIWAVCGAIGFEKLESGPRDRKATDQNGKRSPFAAYVKNSDPQYSTTVDFTTICLKTKAVIDAMSATMKKLGHGLTEQEVIEIVYRNTHDAGEPVPCPVCYVFARWVGLGGLLDKMKTLQERYGNTDTNSLRDAVSRLERRAEKIAGERGYKGKKNQTFTSDDIKTLSKTLQDEYFALQDKQTKDKLMNTRNFTEQDAADMRSLKKDIDILDEYTWIKDVRLSERYRPVPDNVLFDINAGVKFATDYPDSWTYRTTRGPAMGKAATPYAPLHLGQITMGVTDAMKDPAENVFLKEKTAENLRGMERKIKYARERMRRQNLLNGQRYQSTSDFRFEYGLDYLLSFVEMQALGGKIQMYTKVPEAVRTCAQVGAEVNLSLMPLGMGYTTNPDGTMTLTFSSVTGMNADDAFRLTKEFDNVQTIMVGTSDQHILLCFADDRIHFIIPYHSSGASEERYKALMDIVKEHIAQRDDYSEYQSDHRVSKPTEEQKLAYSARLKIIGGEHSKLTSQEKDIVRSNHILSELCKRFTGNNVDGVAEAIDPKLLSGETNRDGTTATDPDCIGVKIKGDSAKVIMPYEYWDRSTTIDQADTNAEAFIQYCKLLGLHPRFSGWDSKGAYHPEKDFSRVKGYWKTLPDRQMYNRDGSYHEQQTIDVTAFDTSTLFREEAIKGVEKPSIINDPNKTNIIAEKSAQQVRSLRDKSIEARSFENEELSIEDVASEEDIDDAVEFSDAKTRFSLREEEPPKKTGIAYKVFLAKDGELYPPMVANPNGEGTPVGVWLNADVGRSAGVSAEGRPQVEAGGKGTSTGKGKLAFRPGWHLGDIPRATQFARSDKSNRVQARNSDGSLKFSKKGRPVWEKNVFPANFVWAECEYAMDENYQDEAMSYGYTPSGKFRHSYAGLPKLPQNGYYRYRTNPKPDTVPWVITGAMKVNRILTDGEVAEICRKNGVDPMPRLGGDIDLAKYGLKAGPTEKKQFSINESYKGEIREWDLSGRPDGETFILGSTGGVLQGLGAVENDIYMLSDKMNEILRDHPEMTVNELERIPEILEDPVLIARSKGADAKGSNTRLVVFGAEKATNGKPIMPVLDLMPTEDGITIDDMQKVNSAYTKKNPGSFISSSEILYADKKRTIPLLRSLGLQYRPRDLLRNGSYGIISYPGSGVKISGEPFEKVFSKTGKTYSLTEELDAMDDQEAADYLRALASDYGTESAEALFGMLSQYGAIESGETPARSVLIPERTSAGKKVSKTIRTVAEAEVTLDEDVPDLLKLVENGNFSYTPYCDKDAISKAEAVLAADGDASETFGKWTTRVQNGVVDKDNTVLGWALYNYFANKGEELKDSDAEKARLNKKRAVEVLHRMVTHQRNAAQAVQAGRILKQMSPSAQLYSAQLTVDRLQEELKLRYGKKAPDLKIDEELAQALLDATTEKEIDEARKALFMDIGRQMPTTFIDKWNAWRYLAMLCNARTHVRNLAGNLGFVPAVVVKNVLATGIEMAASGLSGEKFERSKAFLTAKDADLIKAARADYAEVAEKISSLGKYNDAAMTNKYIEEGRRAFAFKPLEALRRGNSNLLEAEDILFARPHYANALAQYCKANGISAAVLKSGKGAAAANARAYAIKEAQKATYRDANCLSDALSSFGKYRGDNIVLKAGSAALEGVLPFRRTPANILARGIEYSPLALVTTIPTSIKAVRQGKATAASVVDSISAGLTGSGLLMLGLWMAAEGLVRGIGGDDDKEKEFEELQGHQSYALEVGDKSITLDWLAPESLPFFIGVNFYEMSKAKKKDAKIADLLTAAAQISAPLLEMSCLQSFNDLIDSVGYSARNDGSALWSLGASAATSYLMQAIPTLSGQGERTSEPYRMTTYTDKNGTLPSGIQYTLGKASAKIPGWEYGQIPYIDAWGRKESNGEVGERAVNNLLNPAYMSGINSSAMEKELLRLYNNGKESVLIDRPSKYFMLENKRVDLTGKQYVEYATARGQTARKLATEITQSTYYKSLDNESKAEAIGYAYDYATAVAKTKVSSYKPSGWIASAIAGEEKGLTPAQFIQYRVACGVADANNSNTEKANGSYDKAEKNTAVNTIDGLTYDQKNYLTKGK